MELDSVVGKLTDKLRLFTFMMVNQTFQLGRLYYEEKASSSINEEVKKILDVIKPFANGKTIVLLCDNGLEFTNLPDLECEGVCVFYTTAYKSTDKAHCERNHEYIRYIMPKGNSVDNLTQDKVNEIFSNINSYARKSLKWKSPCELFTEACSTEAMQSLEINSISPNDINLSPLV